MSLSFQEYINIFASMLKKGVVLYGAGKQGIAAVNELENRGIHIAAIADRQVGKNCGRFCAVSIEMLCEQADNEVCIITPNMPLPDVWEKLQHNYPFVVDFSVIQKIFNLRDYFLPNQCAEMDYTLCHPFNCYDSPYIQDMELEPKFRIEL